MKIKLLSIFMLASGLRLAALLHAADASVPRSDINPALLYWQAFAVMPELENDDLKHLFEEDWRAKPMDERAGELAARFNSAFKLMRAAAASKAPCDWGVDMTPGPETLLPHLAKAKRAAQAAVLRARWFSQNGQHPAAMEDLSAAFVLGRQISKDGVLISALVQIAIENIVTGHIAQQWADYSHAQISHLLASMDSAPPRMTIAAAMTGERTSFYDWLVREMHAIQAKHPGDEKAALNAITAKINSMASESPDQPSDLGTRAVKAAGDTFAGLLKYVQQLEPLYREIERVMALPYADFQPAAAKLEQQVHSHKNLLVQSFFPALLNPRLKEFRCHSRMEMLRAALEYRKDPANGLSRVQDPFGSGPFVMTRFALDGVDRGFKLQSALKMPEFLEVLIFAEKAGPPFFIDGPKAGQKVR